MENILTQRIMLSHFFTDNQGEKAIYFVLIFKGRIVNIEGFIFCYAASDRTERQGKL